MTVMEHCDKCHTTYPLREGHICIAENDPDISLPRTPISTQKMKARFKVGSSLLTEEQLKEIDNIAKVPSETRRYIELLEKVLETGKLWIESRNLPAHDSLGTHTLQRVDWISDLRRDFETAISEAIEERPSDGEENSQT